MKTLNLPDGNYWVGDPCYVYPDEHWSDFVDRLYYDACNAHQGWVKDNEGNEFLCFNTAYGDGGYPVTLKGDLIGTFGVDAGLVSVIPMDIVLGWGVTARALSLGLLINVAKSCELVYDKGDITFGDFKVITRDTAPYYDDEGDESDDEDDESFEDDY